MEIQTRDVDRLSECAAGDSFEIRSLSDSGRAILQELAGSPSDWHCLSSLKSGLVTDVERLIVGRAVSFSRREIGIPRGTPAIGCVVKAQYLPDGTMGWFHMDGSRCTCEQLPFEGRVVPIASIRITAIGLELLQARVEGGLREVRQTAAATTQKQNPFAMAAATIPDAYKEQGRECGPLEGTKTALARAVTGNLKAKPEDLEPHHGGKVFVREIRPRKLEVFFRSFKELNAAKQRLTPNNSE